MSEQDRQKELVKLKLQERQLRKEGRMDEAAALLEALQATAEGLYMTFIISTKPDSSGQDWTESPLSPLNSVLFS